MSDTTTSIPVLEGRSCWFCLDTEREHWTRARVICAWFEASHEDEDDDGDIGSWRVYPTVLLAENKGGAQWIVQMPADFSIRFCEKPLTSWVLVGEE